MKPVACGAVRRLLDAYHDGELPIEEQIAVDGHLDKCPACAARIDELRVLRSAMRDAAGHRLLSNEEAAAFAGTVVSRWKAEQQTAFSISTLRSIFDDMHFVYAGLGAAVATAASIVVMLGMMRYATDGRPGSLGAVVSFLATPGADETLPVIDDEIETRWNARFRQANAAAEQDAVFALQDVVTRKGGLTRFNRLRSEDDARRVEMLLDDLSRARLTDAAERPLRGARMVWVVARTTVRPSNS